MTYSPRLRRIAAAVTASLLPLSLVACTAGEDTGGSAPTTAASPPAAAAGSDGTGAEGGGPASAGGASQPFGPGCPNLPDTGEGSLVDLGDRDWIDAIGRVPALSQLRVTTALAELGDDFSGLPDVTVFAPNDDAFRSLGIARARQLLTNPAEAADVLRYHVVPRRLEPTELPGSHETLTGQRLEVTGSGQDFTVDGRAAVVCGNLQTENATLYLVDQVLQPS